MRRVILESPYAAPDPETVQLHVDYARECILDCLKRGDAPIASHLLYTQMLRDTVPAERTMGMHAGWAWFPGCEAVVVYTDCGISPGMKGGVTRARKLHKPVELRSLAPGNVPVIIPADSHRDIDALYEAELEKAKARSRL